MEMYSVASKVIRSAGFEWETSYMVVEFTNGQTFRYYDVHEPVFQGLITARDGDAYFAENVTGKYQRELL